MTLKVLTTVTLMKTALIDLDSIVYQYADLKNVDGEYLPASVAERFSLERAEKICEDAGCDNWIGYLTFGPDNFRVQVATIKPYKGNRVDKEKPKYYDRIRGFLSDLPNVHMVHWMEADDALGINQTEDTVICSLDKDLDMVPGWHYRWGKGNVKEIELWYQDELNGYRCFFKQMLTGDSVDNIHGLYGVGPKSAYVRHVDEASSVEEMSDLVYGLYQKWYGRYATDFFNENAKLLWIRRTEDGSELRKILREDLF